MPPTDPYHAGERAVQARAGQSEAAAANGRMVAGRIIGGAWSFLAAQPMLVLGAWDGERGIWASLIVGPPGMASTPDGMRVRLDLRQAVVDRDDPAWASLRRTGQASLLAIDLATRRRLRINGSVDPAGLDGPALFDAPWTLAVTQAYPNCPKYIQRRVPAWSVPQGVVRPVGCGRSLSDEQAALVTAADTFFVASVHPDHGTDVSHRGGRPGFVTIESPTQLRVPDYPGNGMFNTLGNIHAAGMAGLLFVDFEGARLLQLVADAAIDWRAPGTGAARAWRLSIRQVRESRLPAGIAWRYVDASPFCP